jgi:membrane protease YdiL (CAAX protease family)
VDSSSALGHQTRPPWSKAELWIGSALIFALGLVATVTIVFLVPEDQLLAGEATFEALIYALISAVITFLFYWKRPASLRRILSTLPALRSVPIVFLLFTGTFMASAGYWRVIPALGYVQPQRPPVLPNAITAVIVAPFVEELLFRSVLFPGFRAHYGTFKAVALSSFVFAVFHTDFAALIPIFLVGVACASLVHETRSIWSSIAFHMAWNGLILLGVH